MFVYGTTDTDYVNEVSSLIEIQESAISNGDALSVEENGTVAVEMANALGMDYTDDKSASLIIGQELAGYDIAIISEEDDSTIEEKYSELSNVESCNISEYNIIDITDSTGTELVTMEDIQSYSGPSSEYSIVNSYNTNIKVTVTNIEKDGYVLVDNSQFNEWIDKSKLCTEQEYIKSLQGTALIDISNPDTSYSGKSVALTQSDRDLLERLVMGEAGNQGYIGAALVAQAIRDTMYYRNVNSVQAVRDMYKYSGSISKTPNQDVLDAVSYIFDEGGYAVRHKVYYFYAPGAVRSSWHESQCFVIEYKGHRFFSTW